MKQTFSDNYSPSSIPKVNKRDATKVNKGNDIVIEKRLLGGVETHITTCTCKNPIAEVHLGKGFKSDPKYYKRLIKTLHENNINVVMITLPDPEDDINYLEDYEKIAKAVFVDGELDKSGFPPTPKFAVTHSTNGFLLTKLLMDEKNAKTIAERYQSGLFAAPYYGSKWHRIPYIGRFGRAYSNYHSDKAVGMTWLERNGAKIYDRLFNKASGYDDGVEEDDIELSEDKKAWANHLQGIYMDGPTSQLLQQIRDKGFPDTAKKFPTIFLTGTQDKVCHNPSIIEVAQHLGARHFSIRGGHSMLRKTKEAPSFLLDIIKVRLYEMKMEAFEKQAAQAQRLLPFYPAASGINVVTHNAPPHNPNKKPNNTFETDLSIA